MVIAFPRRQDGNEDGSDSGNGGGQQVKDVCRENSHENTQDTHSVNRGGDETVDLLLTFEIDRKFNEAADLRADTFHGQAKGLYKWVYVGDQQEYGQILSPAGSPRMRDECGNVSGQTPPARAYERRVGDGVGERGAELSREVRETVTTTGRDREPTGGQPVGRARTGFGRALGPVQCSPVQCWRSVRYNLTVQWAVQ